MGPESCMFWRCRRPSLLHPVLMLPLESSDLLDLADNPGSQGMGPPTASPTHQEGREEAVAHIPFPEDSPP
jgi:hypothetical protein